MANNIQLVCPHCGTLNRLPSGKLADRPQCGSCRKQLFQGKPVSLEDDNFGRFISKNDVPVVVDFWAPWCGPCKMMAPAFAQAAQQLEPHVRLAKLNTEDHQRTAAKYSIRSIPTVMIFKHGKVVASQAGAMSQAQLQGWIRQHL